MLNILILIGTHREGNYTTHVAEFVKTVAAQQPDFSVELINPTTLNLKFTDESHGERYPELQKKFATADAFIIVSPEYNQGYPGTLKFILDLYKDEYVHKAAAIVGVSSGVFGGARMIHSLTPVLRKLSLSVVPKDVNFGMCEQEIVNGAVVEPEKWQRRIEGLLQELTWLATLLQKARQESTPQ